MEKPLDYDNDFLTYAFPKSHVPVGVRRPRLGEVIGKVPGTNPSSRYSRPTGKCEDILKQRRCRAFLVSAGFPTAGLLKRHTFIAGSAVGLFPPIHGRQANPSLCGLRFTFAASSAMHGSRGLHRLVPVQACVCPLSSTNVESNGSGNMAMTTARIIDFLNTRRPEGPCLVVDPPIVRDNFKAFRHALPDSAIYYAVKANPAPEVLRLLAGLGSTSIASRSRNRNGARCRRDAEPHLPMEHDQEERGRCGAPCAGHQPLCGWTATKRSRRSRAPLPVPCLLPVLTDGEGAEWPLSKQVRLRAADAVDVLVYAHHLGLVSLRRLVPCRSQMTEATHGMRLLPMPSVSSSACQAGHRAQDGQHGAAASRRKYLRDVTSAEAYGQAIFGALKKHFGNTFRRRIIEPGRGMVGNAGVIKAEVVLVSKKVGQRQHRWVFLDIGKFGGLAETMATAIRYPIRTAAMPMRWNLTCSPARPANSADVLYEKKHVSAADLADDRRRGYDRRHGRYTTTYSAVASTASSL